MLVTVAIPVYNAERTVADSIRSVLSQSFQDFELIITDDGSTDGTMDIVRAFDDPRLVIVCDGQHKGLALRLNEQIAMARGEYFARMDADDVMLPHRLERQTEFFKLHPETDVLGLSAVIINERSERIGWRGSKPWKRGAGIKPGGGGFSRVKSFMHPTVMGRTEWFRSYYYNPACEGCEDQDLWLRSCKYSCFYSLYEPLMLYRDPQKLDLKTYLFRQEKGIYVQKLNSASSSWWSCQRAIAKCRIKSLLAILLSHLGLSKWIIKARNYTHSPLNNHVLHVITSLRTGGAEKLMVDLLPMLQQKGIDAELVLFDSIRTPFYEQLEKLGVKIHALRTGRSVYDVRNIFALIPLMRNADIVHTHNTAPQLFAAIANLFVGADLITTEHNTQNRRRNYAFLKPIDKWMYGQYRRIISISDQATKNLLEYIGDSFGDKVVTIYNGINIEAFLKEPPEGKTHEKKVITMVAAFREQKDQKSLIRAIALLPDNYMLQLVGTGDEGLIKDCERLVSDLHLEQKVSFLGMRNDVPDVLAESDVVVLSSHYEGLSLSSLEGLASGRPFIASDVDGLHEIVDGYGILVPHEDPQALADAIRSVSEDREYAKHVADRCVERAKMFDISVMAEKYSQLYL